MSPDVFIYYDWTSLTDYDEYQQVAQSINLKRQALEAFQATLSLFQEQIDSRKSFENQVFPHEIHSFNINQEQLMKRHRQIQKDLDNEKINLRKANELIRLVYIKKRTTQGRSLAKKNPLFSLFFLAARKKNSREKNSSIFSKKLKEFCKNTQIRQLSLENEKTFLV